MKKPKISFDSAKMQQMMLLHVEKIVLGLVLVAVLWFVYSGATLPKLDTSKTPDVLTQKAQQMTTEINNPAHWDGLKEKRKVKHDVQGLVKQGQLANVAANFPIPNGYKIPDFPKAIARIDPRLFAPNKPTVIPLHGPMAFLPRTGEVDPIIGTTLNASGIEGMMPQPQPGVRPPGVRPGPQGPRPSGEGPGPTRPKTRPKRGGVLEEGLGEMAPPMMGPGMEGMPGTPGNRVVPPEAIVGYHASGEIIAREARAVVIMAAVPLEKQYEEFDKAFKEALEYDPLRDIPRYVLYRIERADVTANPAIDPAQATWESLAIGRALQEMAKWGPSPREVIDPTAYDPILTNPVPPFMQRQIYDALVIPEIPIAKITDPNQMAGVMEGNRPGDAAANAAPVKESDLTDPGAALPIPGANPAAMGEGGMRMGPGPGMMPGRGPVGPGMRMGPGMMPGYGEGMPGMNPGSPVAIAKYRLLRFTDTTVQPLKKYRYRVRLILEDPNNPYVGVQPPRWDASRTTPLRKPPQQSMTANALTRIRAAEASKDATTRPFLRETDPSEPSDIVELPETDRYFAGKATPGNGNPLPVGTSPNVTYTPPVLSTQPSANVLTVTFDSAKAVDVPAEKEVFRGSTLNCDKDVDVIHPAKLSIHHLEKHAFRTNSIVVDFVGGNDIPSMDPRRSDKVPKPCEILLFDGTGKLQLLDEADDVEGFRRYLPPKEEVAKPNSAIGPEAEFPGGLLEGPARQPNRNRNKGAGP